MHVDGWKSGIRLVEIFARKMYREEWSIRRGEGTRTTWQIPEKPSKVSTGLVLSSIQRRSWREHGESAQHASNLSSSSLFSRFGDARPRNRSLSVPRDLADWNISTERRRRRRRYPYLWARWSLPGTREEIILTRDYVPCPANTL